MDDDELQKVTHKILIVESNLVGLRNSLNTFPLVEKMSRVAELIIL